VKLLEDDEINYDSNYFLELKSNSIKNKINSMQFVQDCSKVKKLVCEVEQRCGYMCQLHFLTICYIQAYYQNRTVIFKDWKAANELDKQNFNNFQDSFLPFSNCSIHTNESVVAISGIEYIMASLIF